VVKEKTSVYVDRELWARFKRRARRRGVDISDLLEEVIRDGLVEDALDSILLELAGSEEYELDFDPVKPREGLVSELVRELRDERAGSVSGQ